MPIQSAKYAPQNVVLQAEKKHLKLLVLFTTLAQICFENQEFRYYILQ
ncbi:14394_t:CDS:2 [Entrophospora sp. SA101]|nr:14394_t:CDS:2 [Entrophospora sp. SA101]